MNKQLVLIIPSYNSAKTIKDLVDQIFRLYPDMLVLVVDDSSPDGTARIVRQLQKMYKNLQLLVRPSKGGRGTAVIEGLKHILPNKNITVFGEIDADLSHLPQELDRLIEAAEKYDVVIGSRYLPGSQIIGWPILRKLFSPLANIWARLLLGVPISDYTNGYRLYRRRVIEALDFTQISSQGFAVLSEMIYQIYRTGFTIGEVPTTFVFHMRQQSSFSLSEIKEAFLTVVKIKIHYWKKIRLVGAFCGKILQKPQSHIQDPSESSFGVSRYRNRAG